MGFVDHKSQRVKIAEMFTFAAAQPPRPRGIFAGIKSVTVRSDLKNNGGESSGFGVVGDPTEFFLKCPRAFADGEIDIFHHRDPDRAELIRARSPIADIDRGVAEFPRIADRFAARFPQNFTSKRQQTEK